MATKSIGTKVCGMFNIIAGGIGALGGLLMTFLFRVFFGGGGGELLCLLSLSVAGVLFFFSGLLALLLRTRFKERATTAEARYLGRFDILYTRGLRDWSPVQRGYSVNNLAPRAGDPIGGC